MDPRETMKQEQVGPNKNPVKLGKSVLNDETTKTGPVHFCLPMKRTALRLIFRSSQRIRLERLRSAATLETK